MGEILPDGSIQGYFRSCPKCGKDMEVNMQGDSLGHECIESNFTDLKPVNTITTEADIINAGYMTAELKPCPFCGNKNILTAATENETTKNIVYKAWCNNMDCNATIHVCIGRIDKINESRAEVVMRWNTRA